MTSRPAPQRPEWLVPGAEVVVRTSSSYGGRTDVRETTIKTVATHSFTINGSTDRYRVATQDHHGSGNYGSFSQVFPLDSSEARRWLATDRRAKLLAAARDACSLCARGGVTERKHRQAAIAALQAIED